MPYVCSYMSALGPMLMASDDDGRALSGLWFEGQRHEPAAAKVEAAERRELPVFESARVWLDAYFAGEVPGDTPELAPSGTPFQCAVWDELRRLPYGAQVTYGDLAERLANRIDHRTSARAVGGAVGRNPISIMVPCHRVVGADGSLTGYAGGAWRKRALLALERDGLRVDEALVRPRNLIAELAVVWEASVRATHDFLAPGEVERLAPLAAGYIENVAHLLVAWHGGRAVGFIGVDGTSVESLFVAPEYRGHGAGRLLLERAIELLGAREVSVNEENPQAIGFYKHMGFFMWRRQEFDGEGMPHPLLVMRLSPAARKG